jgi:hypothetical protein
VNREEDERFCFRKFNQGDWGLTLATGGFTKQPACHGEKHFNCGDEWCYFWLRLALAKKNCSV